jgi:hypothetical protein
MSVRITHISPKSTPQPTDSVAAHIALENFRWIDEQDMKTGTSNRSTMFDWIVNKKGRAYLRRGNEIIPVFGAVAPGGQLYIRSLEGDKWTDELLNLPAF